MPHRARAAWLLAAAQAASAFYLPGVAPREYGPGERVELKPSFAAHKDLHAPRGGSVGRREVVIYRYLQPAVPKLYYMLGR